jgi:hypothetical protein
MRPWHEQPAGKRLETWLWTGPVGHLLGGAADVASALARHGLTRARTWARRTLRDGAARRAPRLWP